MPGWLSPQSMPTLDQCEFEPHIGRRDYLQKKSDGGTQTKRDGPVMRGTLCLAQVKSSGGSSCAQSPGRGSLPSILGHRIAAMEAAGALQITGRQ